MNFPGVLKELDEHKVTHRNEAVREEARKFTQRLKGWRNQGKLADGVKVKGEIYVRVEGREPQFGKTLSYLDKDVVVDRIIASLLEIQRRNPTRLVVLLTGDTNMLAKADTTSIPTADVPDPE
jgi:predicted ribonuclease YlaK